MSTVHDGLRYTLRGSPKVERHIGATIARAAGLVAANFNRHDYRALVLLGGYGRGEGGVLRERGEERPHNNLDLLLITTMAGTFRQTSLKKKLDEVLEPIVRDEGIGIDTGVISDFELRRAPGRIIWFDLRWGHRTILGDAGLIPSLEPLPAGKIEVDDVHNLLVNRASLLVINDAIVELGFGAQGAEGDPKSQMFKLGFGAQGAEGDPKSQMFKLGFGAQGAEGDPKSQMFKHGITSDVHGRFILKHLMKAIIGHGDAFLFTRGRYHASYLEKQRRIHEYSGVVPGLAVLYEMAATFHFEPDYTYLPRGELALFVNEVRRVLSRAHLEFERFRSGNPHCTFSGHVERVLYDNPVGNSWPLNPKRLYRLWKYGRPGHVDPSLSPSLANAIRHSHPRKLLAAALPTVLHGSNDTDARLVQKILGAEGCTPHALRQAYLRHWAMHGDPNFQTTAKRLGLSIETTGSVS